MAVNPDNLLPSENKQELYRTRCTMQQAIMRLFDDAQYGEYSSAFLRCTANLFCSSRIRYDRLFVEPGISCHSHILHYPVVQNIRMTRKIPGIVIDCQSVLINRLQRWCPDKRLECCGDQTDPPMDVVDVESLNVIQLTS